MSILKAAKHYGLARKQYRFEMKIHSLILPTSGNKLVTRVLWSRRKKRSEKYKTLWIEGIEEFKINQVITHSATIFLTSTTNQIQSKYTTISIEIKNEICDKKYTKYCSFKIDLSDYINITMPNKIFSKHLKYKNNSGTKKAELIFSIKSKEITNNIINNRILNDRESLISEDESQTTNNTANTSHMSLISNNTSTSKNGNQNNINSKTFNELRKTHVDNQRKLLHLDLCNQSEDNNNYKLPTIHRTDIKQELHNEIEEEEEEEERDNMDDVDELSDNPPPFFLHEHADNNFNYDITPISNDTSTAYSIALNTSNNRSHNSKKNSDIKAGSAISICSSNESTTESDTDSDNNNSQSDSDSNNNDNENENENDNNIYKMKKEIKILRKKLNDYNRMRERLKINENKMEKLKKNIKLLQKDNSRLQLKVSSLQTVIEHKKNEKYNTFSVFKYLQFKQCENIKIGDYIDHRDETGHFLLAKIINLNKKKNYIHIHYEGWASKWDIWINLKKECNSNKIAKPRSISRKSNTRFIDLQISDNIDINPIQRHCGWRQGKIKKMDKYSGQVQVEYIQNNEKYFYWAHLNDINEITPYMTKSCD